MAFQRLFGVYSADGTLYDPLPNTEVVDARCEFVRQGGCGSGSLLLRGPMGTYNITPGMHVQFWYDIDTAWYIGRVEEVAPASPSGTAVRLFGWMSYLNDIQVGGRGQGDSSDPLHYVHSDDPDAFPNDPDKEYQTRETMTTLTGMLQHIANNYVTPSSPITLSSFEVPTDAEDNKMISMIFRGEDSVSQIFRQVCVALGWSSWGVQENGVLFIKNLPTSTSVVLQEGVNVYNLSKTVDRSKMFNRLIFTGGPVYGTTNDPGFYHYRRNIVHYPSILNYGEKKISLTIPWLRTNEDVYRFIVKLFHEFAGPTTNYTFGVLGDESLGLERPIVPWLDRVSLLDYAGNELINGIPVSVQYSFNETPMIESMTLGSDDLNFPTDSGPMRHEEYDPTDLGDGWGFNCEGFTEPLGPVGGFPGWDCTGSGEGVLKNALTPPADLTSTPASTIVTVYRRDPTTHLLTATTEEVEVFSSDPGLEGAVGAYCRWKKIGGVNQFTYLSCAPEAE